MKKILLLVSDNEMKHTTIFFFKESYNLLIRDTLFNVKKYIEIIKYNGYYFLKLKKKKKKQWANNLIH